MTDEIKDKTDESVENQENKDNQQKSDAETKSEEQSKDDKASDIDNIDYKAKADEYKDRANKAEKALAGDRYKKSHQKEDNPLDDENLNQPQPVTEERLKEILSEDRQVNQKIINSNKIEDLAKSLSNSPDEANYIISIHKDIVFPSHYSLDEQVKAAHAIANSDKLRNERDEALRAVKNKDNANKDASGTHQEGQTGSEPKMSEPDKKAITAAGYKYNATNKRYEKKLANKETLVYDPQTKKTTVIK